MNKRYGFTLLELLVVIIIVGVLASVAMPALFRVVKRSHSAEARHTLGIIKRAIDACSAQDNGNPLVCAPNSVVVWDNIGIPDPSSTVNPGSYFDYTVFCGGVTGNYSCSIVARDVLDNANSISLNYTQASISWSGAGEFAGIR